MLYTQDNGTKKTYLFYSALDVSLLQKTYLLAKGLRSTLGWFVNTWIVKLCRKWKSFTE